MRNQYDVFISYARKDYVDENRCVKPGNIVSDIKEVLDKNNISYWFDVDGVYSGDAFADIIARQIEAAKVFLFISSENSNSSVWTSREIATANYYNKRIIPFNYDNSHYHSSSVIYLANLNRIDYQPNHEMAFESLVSSILQELKEQKQREKVESVNMETTFNFSTQTAENYEQKCLCVLVLDTSGSMNEIVDSTGAVSTGRTIISDGKKYDIVVGGKSKLDKLNEGLISFFSEIVDDENTSQRLEISVITFNDDVEIIQEPALPDKIAIEEIKEAKGETALADAVFNAIDLVNARKAWYKQTGQLYYRPWIILMTDGESNRGRSVAELAERIKIDTTNKKYTFLPIGVDNANMNVLRQIQGNIPAMKLKESRFGDFFKWLSASMNTIVNSEVGNAVKLNNGADWMDNIII